MRIALISTPFVAVPPRKYGGTELMVAELADGLVQRGHEVTLFATGDSTTPAELRWLYPTAQWPPNHMLELDHVTWALQQLLDEEYDVVHANCAPTLAFGRLAAAPPMVYTMHHMREPELSAFYMRFPEVYYVAISHDQARREIQLPRMEVIHHGLDPAKYEWSERAGDYVCFIARFSRVKGPHTAIDIAGAAGVPIRMAGEVHPTDAEFARREVEPRLRSDHVTCVGSVGLREKVPLLRDARALLAPIEWNEPFGLALVEAMLSGCPVVAFARGSVPELVEHGVTGFIARDADAMRDIIRPGGPVDSFDRRRCRERAVERFGRDRMVSEYERLYERAASSAVPPTPLIAPLAKIA
ncbi:MAG TPA: glycosyltransferase family 4 protein [Gemmatimonadaceae bacterium]|nr:glycosyltransferase family 4 protein [Gemmatimonadaceae bacterium]